MTSVPSSSLQKNLLSSKAELILTGDKKVLRGIDASNFARLQCKLSQKEHGSNHRGLATLTEALCGISQSHQTNAGIVLNVELSQGPDVH
jgi:hypothetical protein